MEREEKEYKLGGDWRWHLPHLGYKFSLYKLNGEEKNELYNQW